MRLLRKLKKYMPFLKAGMMQQVSYKGGMYSWLFITVLQLACIIFLWIAVYSNSENGMIHGFSFSQSICYFVCMNIFTFCVLQTDTLYSISDEIEEGTIALSFIKPLSYRWRFLFISIGQLLVRILILGLPATIIAFVVFGLTGLFQISSIWIFAVHVILFSICLMLSLFIFDSIDYICGVLCFYTTNSWGLNMGKNVLVSFFSGALLPLSFYPEKLAKIVKVLPFSGLGQNPILILLEMADIKTSVYYIVRNLLWWIVFEMLGWLLFQTASKKVTVQGG